MLPEVHGAAFQWKKNVVERERWILLWKFASTRSVLDLVCSEQQSKSKTAAVFNQITGYCFNTVGVNRHLLTIHLSVIGKIRKIFSLKY